MQPDSCVVARARLPGRLVTGGWATPPGVSAGWTCAAPSPRVATAAS